MTKSFAQLNPFIHLFGIATMTTELWKVTLEARLLKILSEMGEIPEDSHRIETAFCGRTVLLQLLPVNVTPTAPREPRTDCERDCMDILRSAPKAMTRPEILKAIEREGKLWGESTIARALADLVSDGVLENNRKKGGYFIPS
jgi:hypothetical protein